MSDRVDADIDDLRRLQSDIGQTQQVVGEALEHLMMSLAQTDWNDAVRTSFEQQLTETISSLRPFNAMADDLKLVLGRKIEALSEYLQH